MNGNKVSIEDLNIKGKRVIIRVDFNIPLDDDQKITDDTRIRSTLPTINHAIDEGARVILCSHLGRPQGRSNVGLSLAPVAKRLTRLLEKEVMFAPDCVGPVVEEMAAKMEAGDVLLLENLRFNPGEEKNDAGFAKSLAALADVYIDDAFGTVHRNHASVIGIPKFISSSGVGLLMKREINFLEGAMANPTRPFVAILGGAKVSGKLGVIENLGEKVDKVIIGGGMAFTFYKALGYEVGKSLVEDKMLKTALRIRAHARKRGVKFYLPVDCVIAQNMEPGAETKIVPMQEIPKDWMALDIGPASVSLFTEALFNAKTILWNGPMGVFEVDAFSRGTFAIARAVANSYALTIVGGGDTSLAVHRAGELQNISFISTGGAAALQLVEGKKLPGLAMIPSLKDGGIRRR